MIDSPFTLVVPGGGTEPLRVLEFDVLERLSKPYKIDLVCEAPMDLDPLTLVGQHGVLAVAFGPVTRAFAGFLSSVKRGRTAKKKDEERRWLRIEIRPELRRLKLRRTSRVFQLVSSVDIAQRLLNDHQVAYDLATAREAPSREFCVQHQETDLAFVERILAEDGIAFRFEQPAPDAPDGVEKVILFDEPAHYVAIPDDPTLIYRPRVGAGDDSMKREEPHVMVFERARTEKPKSTTLREFAFQNPDNHATSSTAAEAAMEHLQVHYEHHGVYGENQIAPDAARIHREVTREADVATGESLTLRLSPGGTFTLTEHEDATLDTDYAVVEVHHRGNVAKVAGEATTYVNTFKAVPRETFFAPSRGKKKLHQSVETAIVVGPATEEVYTDALGRIKIQFHWDREGASDDASSCFVRVATNWAGAAFGSQFIPRVGMEVLVAFIGGDIDRPVVVGCLPNATHPPAFGLPAERTRSGFRTSTSPGGGGFNELSFEDQNGGEEIRLRAQRDYRVSVENDMSTVVSGEQSLTVEGRRMITVSRELHEVVQGDARYDTAGSSMTVVDGDVGVVFRGDESRFVAGDVLETVQGSVKQTIVGEVLEHVLGVQSVRVDSSMVLYVGRPEAGGEARLESAGTMEVIGEKKVLVQSTEMLVLKSGDSSIEITPDGVTIKAKVVKIEGTESVSVAGAGPSMNLDKKAEIIADEIKIQSKNASVELDDNAKIEGKKISMKSGEPKPDESSSADKPPTQPLKLKVTDVEFEPIKGKKFEVRAGGVKVSGTTDGDGNVTADIPKDAKVANVTVWTGEYPAGESLNYVVELGEIPAADTVPGQKARLANLGYFGGAIEDETTDPVFESAVADFQVDHKLEPSGVVDDATKKAIVDRHGS